MTPLAGARAWRRALPWATVLAVAIPLQLLVGGPGGLWWSALLDAGHAPLSGLIALAVLQISATIRPELEDRRARRYGLAFALAIIVGALIEASQLPGPRDADEWDLVRDVLGAAAFLLFRLAGDVRTSPVRSVASPLLASGLLTLAFWHLGALTVAYLERNATFPRLCDFEHGWERRFAVPSDADLDVVAAPDGWGHDPDDRVGRLTLRPATYPGLQVVAPYPDWRGYRRLEWEMYSDEEREITLELRIHDAAHTQEYEDRYNRTLTVRPGRNRFSIPLDEVRRAPRGRHMDMAAIANLAIFAHRPEDPITVYLDALRLAGGDASDQP